jgi:hypothetical protein
MLCTAIMGGQGESLHSPRRAAGGSGLLHPIHGRGVLQSSDVISNLIGAMRRMVAAGGKI